MFRKAQQGTKHPPSKVDPALQTAGFVAAFTLPP
jgi:hypothetical protein